MPGRSTLMRRWRERCGETRAQDNDSGISMVEVMVALIVLALFASAAVSVIIRGFDLSRTSHNRGLASSLASAEVDKVRDIVDFDATTLPLGQVISSQTVDNVPFTITRQVEWVNQDSSTGACDGGGASTRSTRAYLNVDVAVTWVKTSGVKPVHDDTIVYPKVGTFDPFTGAVAVKLLDATGSPLASQTVTLSGASTQTQLTASDGCAYFAFMPAGVYTASVTTAGYVDPNGNVTTSNASVGVTVGAITSVQLSYDQAAGVDVTPTPGNASFPAAPGLPIRMANTGLTLGVTAATCGGASSYPCAVRNLYPFPSGDYVWAGSCLDAKPSSPLNVPLDNGSTITSGTSPLGNLTVTLPAANTTAKDVWISHVADASSAGCTTVPSYKVGKTSGGATNQLKVGIPLGQWTVSTTSAATPTTVVPGVRPGVFDVITLSSANPSATALVL